MPVSRIGELPEVTTLDNADKFIAVDDTDTTTKAVLSSEVANQSENSAGSFYPSIFSSYLLRQVSSLTDDISNIPAVYMTSSSSTNVNVKINLDPNSGYIRTTNSLNQQQQAYAINTNNKIFVYRFFSSGSGYTLGVEGGTKFTNPSSNTLSGFTAYGGFVVYLDHSNNKVHVLIQY